ncbi:MAG TPA: alpha/beta hydrolase [Devosiaceae bacterium]|nr:alpha/beta hydrolase [Devosiaceae bacterium]
MAAKPGASTGGAGATFLPQPAASIVSIPTPDGTKIVAYEWGNAVGRPIVFVHGIYQSALTWTHQVSDPQLAGKYRLVAIDLRGHGASDKPNGAEFYREGSRWADDIASLMATLGLVKPVVVVWSYGGRVINDYLLTNGDGRLGGLVYVGARSTVRVGDQRHSEAVAEASRNLASDDPITMFKGTRQFVEVSFERPPSIAEVDALTLASMQTPLYVRRHLVRRPLDYDEALAAVRVPTLVVHGECDRVVPEAVGRQTHALIAHSEISLYPGVGHSPFAEDAGRFNAELHAFVSGLSEPKPVESASPY